MLSGGATPSPSRDGNTSPGQPGRHSCSTAHGTGQRSHACPSGSRTASATWLRGACAAVGKSGHESSGTSWLCRTFVAQSADEAYKAKFESLVESRSRKRFGAGHGVGILVGRQAGEVIAHLMENIFPVAPDCRGQRNCFDVAEIADISKISVGGMGCVATGTDLALAVVEELVGSDTRRRVETQMEWMWPDRFISAEIGSAASVCRK